MNTYVAYREERYRSPAGCLQGIRKLLALSWQVVDVRGPDSGPFLVLFRIDDAR